MSTNDIYTILEAGQSIGSNIWYYCSANSRPIKNKEIDNNLSHLNIRYKRLLIHPMNKESLTIFRLSMMNAVYNCYAADVQGDTVLGILGVDANKTLAYARESIKKIVSHYNLDN